MISLGRLLVAMVTPFDKNGELNLKEAARLARWLIDRGHDGLVVAGSTGEGSALTSEEKLALFKTVKEAVGTRGTVIAGAAGNQTRQSIELVKQVEAAGAADAILATVPAYQKPTQDGMLGHFGAIAESTRLPITLYNIPSRTAANLLPATLLELAARHKNIVGIKESSGDFNQFGQILRERAKGFAFWSGDDYLFLPMLAIGADGVVSVASHVCAKELREMMQAHDSGDVQRAAEIHQSLTPLFEALFATTSPIPVKWALNQMGFDLGECRLPLGAMPQSAIDRLKPLLAPYLVQSARA